jgi:hypothetical protein
MEPPLPDPTVTAPPGEPHLPTAFRQPPNPDRGLVNYATAGTYIDSNPHDLTYGSDRQSKERLSAERIEDSSDSANDYDIRAAIHEANMRSTRKSIRVKGEPPVNDGLPATRRRRRAAQAELAVNSPHGHNLLEGYPATDDPLLSAASQPAHSPVASHDSDSKSHHSDSADELPDDPLDRPLPRLQLPSVPPTQPSVVVPAAQFAEASTSLPGAKLLFFPGELQFTSSHVYTPVATSGKLARRLPTKRELAFFVKQRMLEITRADGLLRFERRAQEDDAVVASALQDKVTFLQTQLIRAQHFHDDYKILKELQDCLRSQKEDRVGLLVEFLPPSVIGSIFAYLSSTTDLPTAFPSASERGFTPMIYKEIVVKSSADGPSLTVKAVRRPLKELAATTHTIDEFTKCLFNLFYIAHITFDLSDPSIEWETLLRPWNRVRFGIRRILLTVLGIDNCHPFAIAEFVAFVSMSTLLCDIDHPYLDLRQTGQATLLDVVHETLNNKTYFGQPPSFLGFEEPQLGSYIVLDLPLASEYFQGTVQYTRSQGMEFVRQLFKLGRSMRSSLPMSRNQVRAKCYDWMLTSGRDTLPRQIASKNIPARFHTGNYRAWLNSQPAVSSSNRQTS